MTDVQPLVRIRDLRVKYGDFEALRGVDLTLNRGRITALLGTNGAGKSSLLRVLAGLQHRSGGEVHFDSTQDPRQVLGYCPQELVLWPDLTVTEQVVMMGELFGFGRKEAKQRALKLIADLELDEKRDEPAARLSGGMRRRLSIAMALVHDPLLLILDEAEVGLDAQTRIMLRSYLRGLARDGGKTVLIASHDIAEVERLADDVVILDRGSCVATGDPRELVRQQAGAVSLEDVFVACTNRSTV